MLGIALSILLLFLIFRFSFPFFSEYFDCAYSCSDKNTTPSGFTLKLRKHIRTRRLEDVRQLGYDRVWLCICFSVSLNS